MHIRLARIEDAEAVSAIAESVRYRAGEADARRGYLVYVGTPAEYRTRIANSGVCYVAEENGKVVAFLLMSRQGAVSTATHLGVGAVAERMFAEDALLVDQIGVSAEDRGKGYGPALYDRMMLDLSPQRMTAAIMHHPLRNEKSIGFFSGSKGWKCIGEYSEGDAFLWGIYEWRADGRQGDPRYPLGQFLYGNLANELDLAARVERLRVLPDILREAVSKISDDTLDLPIRPGAWSARQILHHMADGHGVMMERARLILTEEQPPVKTFDENLWVELADAKTAPVEESLRILEGLHARFARLIASRPHADMEREMFHPEQGLVKLDRLLAYLDWHGRHHTAQLSTLISS
jgi:uncharacterized damage-inducible protein DinB/ribosomal protein S18 acetylase RimI-like enzyme